MAADAPLYLEVDRCPQCFVDNPSLEQRTSMRSKDYRGSKERLWGVYECARCGGFVLVSFSLRRTGVIEKMYPDMLDIVDDIPVRAREYLRQARETIYAPDGSVMLSASAVDAMLKAKKYTNGSLYKRINKAAEDHLITLGMAEWAHSVRLEANTVRHSDENFEMCTEEDAKRSVEFAFALAEFLFVLPARVKRGMESVSYDGS